MCDTVSRWNYSVVKFAKAYSKVIYSSVNMQMLWVYCEVIFLVVIVLLQGLIPSVIVKQLGQTVVTTKYGQLRGALVEFPKDSYIYLPTVESYSGIQYGSLHDSQLRFIYPKGPVDSWSDIKSAWDDREVCPQRRVRDKDLLKYYPKGTVEWITRKSSYTKDQVEDCLSMNIYVPRRGWSVYN